MPDRYTFEIENTPQGFKGICCEVPAACGFAQTLEGCAANVAEAALTALQENESILTIKTFTLDAEGLRPYAIRMIHSSEGFAIGCTDLPGCWSQGASEQEAVSNIKEAIEDYLEVAREMTSEHQQQLIKVA